MARRRQPTARQTRLGTELQRLREASGLKGREAAAALGTDSARLSQIESGVVGMSENTVRRLAANYACTDEQLIDALVAMATERTQGWWEKYQGILPVSFLDIAELEHHASHRFDAEFLHVPGLFQTEDYARGLFSYRVPVLPDADLESRVSHRMDRKVIINGPAPIPYEAVIHEAALRIRVGNRSATRAQLTRILELSEADHITVRVIPFELDEFGGAWSAMTYAGGAVPKLDTALRDTAHGTAFIDSEAQLGAFRTLFRKVEAVSLEPERSRDFIHKLAKEL
ncbi:helix-turn-helix domain-containing protein [Streptomyces beigongshangae]|uniref:helix-turn-helix domain-containing protein n=1 Tax=Streptomyces beigongshangae TaxID=2841597 RepID=UPI001C84F29B|nr:helix-turn-helix transcriptional regulator [Streptomyces sp. REN17]